MDEEFEEEFDEVKPKSKSPRIDIPVEDEIPIPDEAIHRMLQKGDVIKNNETYDTEAAVQDENVNIITEKFRGEALDEEPPIISSPKDIVKNGSKQTPKEPQKTTNISKSKSIPLKSEPVAEEDDLEETPIHFEQDKDNPIPIKGNAGKAKPKEISNVSKQTSEEAPKKNVSIPKKTTKKEALVPSDLDEDSNSKEYISRHSIIAREAKGMDVYSPPKKTKYSDGYDEDAGSANWGKIFIIVLAVAIVFGGLFWGVKSGFFKNLVNSYGLSDLEKATLNSEYDFVNATNAYLEDINKLVETESQIIDDYIGNQSIDGAEAIRRLTPILENKNKIYEEYSRMRPTYSEVVETKRIADRIFANTIACTEESIESINNLESKTKIGQNFNNHIDTNNSERNMYIQYYISVFQRRNIEIIYEPDGKGIKIDTSWIKK
jgi:hypothetical protein